MLRTTRTLVCGRAQSHCDILNATFLILLCAYLSSWTSLVFTWQDSL